MLRRGLGLPYQAEAVFLAPLLAAEPPRGPAPDTRRLVAAAFEHRVTGYLLDADRRGQLRLPPAVRRRLSTQRALDAVQADFLRQELSTVHPCLRAACGADPVLIKGAAVAERLYPERGLRPFSDLDLVVPRERLRAAAAALRDELGYESAEEPWSGFGEGHGHHLSMLRRQGASLARVDLHWRVSDDPAGAALDHARLLSRARRLKLAHGELAMIPHPEDELVVLALHLLHEQDKRLIWINDIALAAWRASDAEWLGAFASAHELGLGWVLHRGLDYAAKYLDLDRARPGTAPRPLAWGPLRAGERTRGWVGFQLGRLALGGWRHPDGYLRSAARARRAQLGLWLHGRDD